ncbi:putative ankyrin repeat protein RF_0381 [Haliotis asinina]|uniref:putative ankyrin repeat protein RF_0381 n=1 Tax=Haliotis asinina TaxID=109174 RepID=UPI00353277A5
MCSNSSLQIALSACVYVMGSLFICVTTESKECGLQMTEKLKGRSAVLRNIDKMLCQFGCVEDCFVFASCRRLRATGGASILVNRGNCGSRECNETSLYVEDRCKMGCLKAPPLCDLYNASEFGDFSRVNTILSQGRINTDCQDWIGRTAVMCAALKGHLEVVQLLVTKGANVNLIDKFANNILHLACLGGDVDVVKYILSQDMAYIDGRAQRGRTPMMLAAENGHKEVVELLVGEGADMSLVDKQRDNILHCACRGGDLEGGHLEVVTYIVSQNKVDINSRGWKQKTPVMVAAEMGKKDVVEFLVEHGADLLLVKDGGSNILHLACKGGYVEVVKYIVSQNKVDINSAGWKQRTPVIVAAEMGEKDVVEFLVEHGADLLLVKDGGSNILHLACKGGHLEVVKYIVSQNKVDINSRGWLRKTPVMVAAEMGEKKVVEFLVEHGGDLSLVHDGGNNILHLACKGGHLVVVKYIVSQNKVDINSRGWKRKTPMMVAAEMGKKDVVEFLVEHGADLLLVNDSDSNILHLACKGGHLEVVKYIVSQNKVDINSRGWRKNTPVMLAAKKGHKKVVEFLVRKGADLKVVVELIGGGGIGGGRESAEILGLFATMSETKAFWASVPLLQVRTALLL